MTGQNTSTVGRIESFLEREGAVELFRSINPVGSTRVELVRAVPAEASTVESRVTEARDLGLVSVAHVGTVEDEMRLFVPTQRGMVLCEAAVEVGWWEMEDDRDDAVAELVSEAFRGRGRDRAGAVVAASAEPLYG